MKALPRLLTSNRSCFCSPSKEVRQTSFKVDRPSHRHLETKHPNFGTYQRTINYKTTNGEHITSQQLRNTPKFHPTRTNYTLSQNIPQRTKELLRTFHSTKVKYSDPNNIVADQLLAKAELYMDKENYSNALVECEEAIQVYMKLGDRKSVCVARGTKALCLTMLGDHQRAIDLLTQNLEEIRALGDIVLEAKTLHALGVAQSGKEDYQTALMTLHDALAVAVRARNKDIESQVYHSFGTIYSKLNLHLDSIPNFEKSFKISASLGKQRHYIASVSLAREYKRSGNNKKALEIYEVALKVAEALPLRWQALTEIAKLYGDEGGFHLAIDKHKEALKLAEQSGHETLVLQSLHHLCSIYQFNEQFEEAIEYNKKIITLSRIRVDIRGIIGALADGGRMQFLVGNKEAAKTMLEESLLFAQKKGEGTTRLYLAFLYEANNDIKNTTANYLKAIGFGYKFKDVDLLKESLMRFGRFCVVAGDIENGIKYLRQSIPFHRKTGDGIALINTYAALGDAFRRQKKKHAAAAATTLIAVVLKEMEDRGMLHEEVKRKLGPLLNALHETPSLASLTKAELVDIHLAVEGDPVGEDLFPEPDSKKDKQ